MKRILLNLVVSLLFLFSINVFAKEPTNLNLCKERMKQYHDSGEYTRDIVKVTEEAKRYLIMRLQEKQTQSKKIAMVIDIDDTAISGYQHLVARDFGGDLETIFASLRKGDNPAISAVLDFYNFAKQHQVAIFFVSGRPQNMRLITEKNLTTVGYQAWAGLFLRPDDYNKTYKTIVPFKVQMRKQLADQGYDVVLNLGDQESDLNGGYADKTFKLPDPFYYIP